MIQLLIVLALVVSLGTTCPMTCTCRHYPRKMQPRSYLYYTSVKCQTLSPNTTLENTTTTLELSLLNDTSLQFLTELVTEQELPFLNTLIIKDSDLSSVSDYIDVISEKINYLSLLYSNLTVAPDFPDNASHIHNLDLSNNKIESIALRTLPNLEILNLSANSLTEIANNTFESVINLKSLDISKNKISNLHSRSFNALINLQYLNLSFNRLQTLRERCFDGLIMLQQLDVSWNNLSCIAAGTLQLPSLSRLSLTGNAKLGKSREILVGAGGRLHSVDASYTGLQQVPTALIRSVRTLKLARNFITTLNCGEVDSYPLLQLLDLASNNLTTIEEDALGRLESLSILYLSDNKIETVPKSLPEALTVLHLESNLIPKLSKEDFEGMSKLEVLLLNDNKIETVELGAFRYLSSLVTLDLSRNPIFSLQPGSLAGPTSLQVLRLSGVETVSPAEDATFPLSSPERLITLDLSGSPGLARQLLADTAALAASRELQELNLDSADLDGIRSDLLHFLTQLRLIRLKGNALNCSGLNWLAAWMRRQDKPEYREVLCASPSELWGTRIIDLQYKYIGITQEQSTTEKETSENTLTVNNDSFPSLNKLHPPLNLILEQELLDNNNFAIKNEIPDANITETTSQWNASTVEMSMYTTNEHQDRLLHPGMLILAAGVLCSAATLTMLAARCNSRKRRDSRNLFEEDIEVANLPSVSELW